MGQIYMGRENPFRALVAGLTVDEFLLFREAVDKKCYRNESVSAARRVRRDLSAGLKALVVRCLEGYLRRDLSPELAIQTITMQRLSLTLQP